MFSVDTAPDAEEKAKRDFENESSPLQPGERALKLAEAKALAVAKRHLGTLVIGADQILEMRGLVFEKPKTIENARSQLKALRGVTHGLETAVVVVRDGAVVWAHRDRPEVTLRAFSDAFLEEYLFQADPDLLYCAGSYQIESTGIQLVEEITGSLFSVQGLPLIPLLKALRGLGALEI